MDDYMEQGLHQGGFAHFNLKKICIGLIKRQKQILQPELLLLQTFLL